MPKRLWVIGAGMAALALVLALAVPALRGGRGEQASRVAQAAEPTKQMVVGKQAEDFTLADPDGKQISLKSLRGSVVLLSFWATWCPPCNLELPHLNSLQRKYQGKPVRVFAVNVDMHGQTLKQWLQKRNLTFTTVSDTDGKVSDRYGVEGIPTLLVLDQTGKIQERTEGFDENMEKNLSRLVDRLLSSGKGSHS